MRGSDLGRSGKEPPMDRHRAVMDLGRDEWMAALGIAEDDIPHAVVLEGSWWREQRTAWRLSRLEDVRELAFPDMFLGYRQGRPVVYSCVYGAPRAVEPAHLFGLLGTPRMVMIGTCGALHAGLSTGDVVVPSSAVAREGVARLYAASGTIDADPGLTGLGRRRLMERDIRAADSLHLSWVSIFAQSGAMVAEWRDRGYGSVDMEAATLYAVARYFGFAAAALLVVWDQLDQDRSFLDPLTEVQQARLDAANEAVFDVALSIALDADPVEGAR
ncbi:MAG: nucleoside phosphorylase [Acidimicrobiia bacterium]|nr:nucleoside phosphorylase [Acidimicrobiia bacterium]